MHIVRALPAERVVQQHIFWRRGNILIAPHDIIDAHQMIVHDVGKIIGGVAVGLHKNLVLQLLVFHRLLTIHLVKIRGCPGEGHFLPDDIGIPVFQVCLDLLLRKIAAVAVIPADSILIMKRPESLLGAEAVIGIVVIDQPLRIFLINLLALALNIWSVRPADVRTLVILKTRHPQRVQNHLGRAFHEPFLIRILDPENKFTPAVLCNQIGIQRRAQISDMHEPRRRRSKTCDYHSIRHIKFLQILIKKIYK